MNQERHELHMPIFIVNFWDGSFYSDLLRLRRILLISPAELKFQL